jgi:hypothetical protein
MAPACNPGDRVAAHDACVEISGISCYERSACGTTIGCQREHAQCDGTPECNPGYGQVNACAPDSDCKTVTACGVTILCQKADPPCEGPAPICDPGDKQVSSQSECLQDAKCYARSVCNSTIWCTG